MDDHRAAALKHLKDAVVLIQGSRWDGAAYLSGYVVECTMKAIIKVLGEDPREDKHNFVKLEQRLNRLAASPLGSKCPSMTQYQVLKAAGIYQWKETLRYRAEGHIDAATSKNWFNAAQFFNQSVKP